MALGLIESVVQGVGDILALRVAIGRNAPIGSGLGFIAAHRSNRRTNDVFLGRRDSNFAQALQQCRIQLIAIDVIGLPVSIHAPRRLVDDLVNDRRVFCNGHCLAKVGGFWGLVVLHGVPLYVRQSAGGGSS